MGAWIETRQMHEGNLTEESHPTWVRGLKHELIMMLLRYFVSHPTWVRGLKQKTIKLERDHAESHPTWVRGLKLFSYTCIETYSLSHPTWVRGLKPLYRFFVRYLPCRTLHGCVD